jgi:hypothetical protein
LWKEENETEALPRGYDVGANKEVYQFSEANGESIGLQRGSGREMSLWIICACLLLRLFRALTRQRETFDYETRFGFPSTSPID